MSEYVYAGLTSQTIDIFLADSSSTTGGGLTGLVYNTSNLTAYYRKGATGTATAITLATQTVGGAYSSGGFVQIDSTNMPGVYRLDLPNAMVDTAGFVTLYLRGATNLVPTALRIDCRPLPVDVKLFGGTAGTFSSGRPEVNTTHVGGTSQTARDIGASVLLSNGTGTGQIKLSSGYVSPNWGDVANPTTTVDLTGTTISSSQAVASVSGAVGSVTGGVTVTTNNDKTGYSLSSSQTFNLTGNITGNLSGSVGSVTSAITLPTIPVDWITSSGIASSAVSEIQSGLATASQLQQVAAELPATIADAVWEDLEADHPVTGTMGAALGRTSAIKTKTDNLPTDPADASDIASSFTTVSSKLDAIDDYIDTEVAAIKAKTDNLPADPADASDIAASFVTVNSKLDAIDDYIDTEVAAIKAKTDNLPTDPADASDIAASFVTVNSKLDAIDDYVDTEVAAIKVVTDKYATMIVQDGVVYQYTTNSLENGPSGGGGGSTVAVYPLNATMPARVYDLNITFYKDEDGTVAGPIAITSRNANVFEPVDLSGRTLSVRFVDYEGTELLTVANGDITVSGVDNNQISFPVTTALTGSVTEAPQDQWHIWTLHDLTSGDNVLIGGKARVLLC